MEVVLVTCWCVCSGSSWCPVGVTRSSEPGLEGTAAAWGRGSNVFCPESSHLKNVFIPQGVSAVKVKGFVFISIYLIFFTLG